MYTSAAVDWPSLRINVGGELPLQEIVGRDRLVLQLIERLRVQSVLLTAERRVGKTTVLTKLAAEVPQGWLVAKRSFESVRTPEELVGRLVDMFDGDVTLRLRDRLGPVLDALGVTKIEVAKVGAVERAAGGSAWRPALDRVFDELEQVDGDLVLVLFDELPHAIGNIADACGVAEARAVLDILRERRQRGSKVRMVCCGSIGLHHALKKLHNPGQAWAPVNDLVTVEVGALADEDAVRLATQLLVNHQVLCSDAAGHLGAVIAEQSEGMPFFIHAISRDLRDRADRTGQAVTTAAVIQVVAAALDANDDPWKLAHYEDRLKDHYGDEAPVVRAILDGIAVAGAFHDLAAIEQAVAARRPGVATEDVRRLLNLLRQDHYLAKDDRGYRFRMDLLGEAWRRRRDL